MAKGTSLGLAKGITGKGAQLFLSFLILVLLGGPAHAVNCELFFGWLRPSRVPADRTRLTEYVGPDVLAEVDSHIEKKASSFFAGVQLLVSRLPSDAKSKRDQARELAHLEGVVAALRRTGQSGSALTYDMAQRLVALSIRQGTRRDRWNERHELAGEFQMGRSINEARLLEIEADLARRDSETYRERGGVTLLKALSIYARDTKIRVEAHLLLAELGAIDSFSHYEFDGLFSLFPSSGISRERLISAIHSWADHVFERFVGSAFSREFSEAEFSSLFEGRSASFLVRFFHKSADIREAAVRATIGNRDPEILSSISNLVSAELTNPSRRDSRVLLAAIDALKGRADRESFDLLARISKTATDVSVADAAFAAILSRAEGGGAATDAAGHLSAFQPEKLEANVRDTLIFTARKGTKPLDRVAAHNLLLARGESEHLVLEDLGQIARDWKSAGWSEGDFVSLVQRLPDKWFIAWGINSNLSGFSPQATASMLKGRSLNVAKTFLRDTMNPAIRVAGVRALIGNYEVTAGLALSNLVTQELARGRPGSKEVLLAAIEALRGRTDHLSRRALESIAREAPRDVAAKAEQAILSDFERVRRLFGAKYLDSSVAEQAQETIKGLSSDTLELQLKAADALLYLPVEVRTDQRVLSPFAQALDSPHEMVRVVAARALLNRSDPESRKLAIRISENPNEFTRVGRMALQALSRMNHPDSRRAIERARLNPNEAIRREALKLSRGDHKPEAADAMHLPRSLASIGAVQLLEGDRNLRTAAGLSYLYPEPGPGKSGTTLVNEYERLERMVPEGATLVNGGCDLPSSFKWIAIESERDGKKVITIGIAGSQRFTDWMIDFNFGLKQLTNSEYRRVRDFAMGKLKNGYEIEIGGHSLGGVATQSLAYELEVERKSITDPPSVRFATFCGLGAVTALTRMGNYDPIIGAQMNGMNYRFSGDLVSRVGPQIGQSISIPGHWHQRLSGIPGLRNVADLLPAVYLDHLMGSLGMTMDTGGERSLPAPQDVASSPLAPVLYRPIGLVTESIAALGYTVFKRQYLKSLQSASLEWAKKRGYRDGQGAFRPFDHEIESVASDIGGNGWVERSMASFKALQEKTLEEGSQLIRETFYTQPAETIPAVGN